MRPHQPHQHWIIMAFGWGADTWIFNPVGLKISFASYRYLKGGNKSFHVNVAILELINRNLPYFQDFIKKIISPFQEDLLLPFNLKIVC